MILVVLSLYYVLDMSLSVFENRLNVQTFLTGYLAKRPRAIAGFTHKCLLLSILGQKKTATAPMSNYGFSYPYFIPVRPSL